MSNPSPYLEASRVRWADRGDLLRRDITMMLEGLSTKKQLLDGLRKKIERHRSEDAAQLRTARVEVWSRWGERLSRINEWRASTVPMLQASSTLLAWREGAIWFDRAQRLSQRYGQKLERQIQNLEKLSAEVSERIGQWSDRIIFKEMELREFMDRRLETTSEVLVPLNFKRSFLEFLFTERERKGGFDAELKRIASESSRALERFSLAEERLSRKADVKPAYFEIRKNQVLESWRPLQERLMRISQQILNQGLPFEESHQRLRGIFEVVQKMRAVEVLPSPRRPLLSRLFHLRDD